MTGPAPHATTKRPRVMQVITHLDMGGAEGIAINLIERLHGEIDFTLFAVLRHREMSAVGREMADRLATWKVPVEFGVGGRFKSGGVVLAALAIARAVRRHRIDLVHLHTEIPELTYAVACALSPRLRRVPLLRTVHNVELWIDWDGIGRWVTGRLAHGTAVAVSNVAADADAAILTRMARPRAETIYNGATPPPPAGPRAPDAPVRVLFAGRLVHQKAADLLPAILKAAHRPGSRRDVEVTIAGSGAMESAVAASIADGLDGWSIQMVPPIECLSARLGEYDCVLVPSRFEGFGLLALETLMAGVPLVTTDAPGLNEVVPADYPLRAAVEDVDAIGAHLAAVIADPAAWRPVAARFGATLARKFDPAAMAEAYRTRYRALAAGGSANRGIA